MGNTLYDGHQGLARYPSQQVLYQWNKFEQLASLPHSAFVGQGDMRANSDCWVICKAGEGIKRGKFFRANRGPVDAFTQPLKEKYTAGDYSIRVANDKTSAISADYFAEGTIIVLTEEAGLTNRIMGHGRAEAASGTTYPEFKLELEYPWQDGIAIAATVRLMPQIYSQVGILDNDSVTPATDEIVVGWSPIDVTSGYYFWGKVGGDVAVHAAAAVVAGDAVTCFGTITAGDQGSVSPAAAADDQQIAIAHRAIADGAWGLATLTLGLQ